MNVTTWHKFYILREDMAVLDTD